MSHEIERQRKTRENSLTYQMTYGEPQIRKAVPLALGLISASRPQLPILDTLSKYSHDSDLDVAINAIFAMGLVGAGTNNARLAQMLRQLAVYYAREPDCYMIVRIAQVSYFKRGLRPGFFSLSRCRAAVERVKESVASLMAGAYGGYGGTGHGLRPAYGGLEKENEKEKHKEKEKEKGYLKP